ncbi:MAG: hypothetical protein ACKV2T_39885 [Kofleriaceae bacterium]
MALHTSTIVLAVITAVPFGLAIKDTVQGKTPYGSLMGDVDEDSESLASYEAAQREYEEREAKEQKEREDAVSSLVSAEPGQLQLAGFGLRRDVKLGRHDQELLELNSAAVFSPLRAPDGTLRSLTIAFPQYGRGEGFCSLLSEKLEERWGSPPRTYGDSATRRHYTTGVTTPPQRVTFIEPDGSDRCMLVLEEHVLPADFVNKSPTSTVPLWAIGAPAAKLVEQLGDDAFSDATQIRWTATGVGAGLGTTELYARVVKGKIVTVTAKFMAGSSDTLVEHLNATYGEPTETEPLQWKSAKISLTVVDESAGDHLLLAGQPLPDESDTE